MLRFGNMRLGVKFMIAFLAVGIIPFAVIGIVAMLYANNALSTQAFNQLSSINQIKKHQIIGYLEERMGDMSILAQSSDVHQSFQRLLAYHNAGAEIQTAPMM